MSLVTACVPYIKALQLVDISPIVSSGAVTHVNQRLFVAGKGECATTAKYLIELVVNEKTGLIEKMRVLLNHELEYLVEAVRCEEIGQDLSKTLKFSSPEDEDIEHHFGGLSGADNDKVKKRAKKERQPLVDESVYFEAMHEFKNQFNTFAYTISLHDVTELKNVLTQTSEMWVNGQFVCV